MSRWHFNISKDGIPQSLLGKVLQYSVTLTVKKLFLMFRQLLHFLVTIASCPVIGHHWEDSVIVFLYFAIKYLYTSTRSSTHLKPSLLDTKQTQLLVSPCKTDAPIPSSPSWPSISHLCLQNTQQVSSSMKARKLLF